MSRVFAAAAVACAIGSSASAEPIPEAYLQADFDARLAEAPRGQEQGFELYCDRVIDEIDQRMDLREY